MNSVDVLCTLHGQFGLPFELVRYISWLYLQLNLPIMAFCNPIVMVAIRNRIHILYLEPSWECAKTIAPLKSAEFICPIGTCIALGVCEGFYVWVMREGSAIHVYAGIHGQGYMSVLYLACGNVDRLARYGNSVIMIVFHEKLEWIMQLILIDGGVTVRAVVSGNSVMFACVDRLMVAVIDGVVYRSNTGAKLELEVAATADSYGKAITLRAIERWIAIVDERGIAQSIDGEYFGEFWARLSDAEHEFRATLTNVVVSSYDQELGIHATFRRLQVSNVTHVILPICNWDAMGGL
jgi:hypothetical protein